MRRTSVPFGCWPQSRIDISGAFGDQTHLQGAAHAHGFNFLPALFAQRIAEPIHFRARMGSTGYHSDHTILIGSDCDHLGGGVFYLTPGTTAGDRKMSRPPDRRVNHAQNRETVLNQSDVDSEFTITPDELFCTIERVYKPEP